MVPVVGLEPTRCRHRRILNPLRLPIPSHRLISVPSSACRSVPQDKPSSAPSSKSRLRKDTGRPRRSAYPGPPRTAKVQSEGRFGRRRGSRVHPCRSQHADKLLAIIQALPPKFKRDFSISTKNLQDDPPFIRSVS